MGESHPQRNKAGIEQIALGGGGRLLRNRHKKGDTERKSDKKEAEPERGTGEGIGGRGGARAAGLAAPAEGQAWTGGGDGWRARQFLKAKARRAAESVKFTLLISCNNL